MQPLRQASAQLEARIGRELIHGKNKTIKVLCVKGIV